MFSAVAADGIKTSLFSQRFDFIFFNSLPPVFLTLCLVFLHTTATLPSFPLKLKRSYQLILKFTNRSCLICIITWIYLKYDPHLLVAVKNTRLCGDIPAGLSKESSGALARWQTSRSFESAAIFPSKPPLWRRPSGKGGFKPVQSDPRIPLGICSPGLFSLSTHHLRELRGAKYLQLRRQ